MEAAKHPGRWTELLDRIVAGKGDPPPAVKTLNLPSLDGWDPEKRLPDTEYARGDLEFRPSLLVRSCTHMGVQDTPES